MSIIYVSTHSIYKTLIIVALLANYCFARMSSSLSSLDSLVKPYYFFELQLGGSSTGNIVYTNFGGFQIDIGFNYGRFINNKYTIAPYLGFRANSYYYKDSFSNDMKSNIAARF